MRKISTKLVLLLAFASLVPLGTFGMLTLATSRRTATKLVTERNLKVAQRAAEEVALYLENSLRILQSLAANINRTHLRPWQKEAILKDYVLQFREFRTIHLLGAGGEVLATSSIKKDPPLPEDPKLVEALRRGRPYRSGVFITDQLVPTVSLGFPVEEEGGDGGMVLGIVELLDVWRVVDQLKVGQQGFALIVSGEGRLLAHGDPRLKPLVIEGKALSNHPLVEGVLRGQEAPAVYRNRGGVEVLGVGVPIPGMGWALLIEQPLEEAFVEPRAMTRRLGVFALAFTALACVVGLVGGRRYVIEPINRLIGITRAFARGALDRRVQVSSRDEFGELGRAFNTMASDLERLKSDIQRKEREAVLGRIAGGLVHDLKHPVKNIQNMTGLLDRLFEDEEFRATFRATVARELDTMNRYFDDLADVATPKPLKRVPVDLAARLGEICDQLQGAAASQGVELLREFPGESLTVSGDANALDRIFSNLMSNALEAMPRGGRLRVAAGRLEEDADSGAGASVEVCIEDTGPGIPREIRDKLFEGFVSTKRKGLGLGLSIAKKLTEAHGGTIEINSSEGAGTTCRLIFPLKIS